MAEPTPEDAEIEEDMVMDEEPVEEEAPRGLMARRGT